MRLAKFGHRLLQTVALGRMPRGTDMRGGTVERIHLIIPPEEKDEVKTLGA